MARKVTVEGAARPGSKKAALAVVIAIAVLILVASSFTYVPVGNTGAL